MWITGMILHIWAGIDSSSSLTVIGHGFASFSSDLLHHFISGCWAPATSFNISSQIIDCEEQRANRESRLTWTESMIRSEWLTDDSGSSLTERQRIFPPQTCKTHTINTIIIIIWVIYEYLPYLNWITPSWTQSHWLLSAVCTLIDTEKLPNNTLKYLERPLSLILWAK